MACSIASARLSSTRGMSYPSDQRWISLISHNSASRLYRGISAPILMEAPKRATKFAANDSWGSFYRGLFGVEKQTQGLATLTGATAGATEAFVVVPFELVKI